MKSLPQRDDEAFLDEGLERLVEAWTAGVELPVRELIDARPHLEDRILGRAVPGQIRRGAEVGRASGRANFGAGESCSRCWETALGRALV